MFEAFSDSFVSLKLNKSAFFSLFQSAPVLRSDAEKICSDSIHYFLLIFGSVFPHQDLKSKMLEICKKHIFKLIFHGFFASVCSSFESPFTKFQIEGKRSSTIPFPFLHFCSFIHSCRLKRASYAVCCIKEGGISAISLDRQDSQCNTEITSGNTNGPHEAINDKVTHK